MAKLGFTMYDTAPVPSVPDIADIIAGLTVDQKTGILDGFARKVIPRTLEPQVRVRRNIIRILYNIISEIEERSRVLMRGEVLVSPGDPEADPPVEPTYNTPPATSTELKNQIASEFADYFTETQVTAILAKMVKMSKYDETGTWTFYKNNVIL
jgi:hypothetical protein